MTASAQVDSVIGQVTSSLNESYVGGLSGDGRFAVFESNGNLATENPRNADGNTEMWLYRIPPVPAADLSSGDEVPFTDLNAGIFIRVTNTAASRLPVAGSTTALPIIADDNRDASLNDDGSVVAFVSTRDLVPCATTPTATCGNAFPNFDNPEIYTYFRASSAISQVTATTRGTILRPIYNFNPTISGTGTRVAFLSNADNPIVGQTGGVNTDRTDEIFYSDLTNGAPSGARVQATQTGSADEGDIVNVLSYGPRMSRDGRYIAFESYADLTNENNGTNQTGSAVFVYDANTPVTTPPTNAFRRISPRSNADSGASFDVLRFPTFTDYDANRTPASIVLATRLNIKPDGTIPSTAADGLNPDASRPTQIYSYQLNLPAAAAIFTRLTKLPPGTVVASVQPYASNSFRRITFSMAAVEPGTGNLDLQTETFYLLTPVATQTTPANINFATGASAIPVTASPVPTPSPTATPNPTPSGSPTPSVTPTPITPPAVQGLAPGMLAIVNMDTGFAEPVTPKTAVGSVSRRFALPIELSGVTMTINGAACGLKMVSRRQIIFTVPLGVFPLSGSEVSRPVVINNNGTVIKGNVTIVFARPDIFRSDLVVASGGRARLQNVVNRVPTTEPFNVTTVRTRGGVRVPTVLRLYATGIFIPNSGAVTYTVRIGSVSIQLPATLAVEREPGVYTIDFTLPPTLQGAGNQPVVLTLLVGGITFTSRLDDTAPFTSIL
ncbi:MAG TPA: hypothetical protein VF721_02760 [Pyrinomonadaceae bacterium]